MPARIVVADDDPEFVNNTVMALRGAGYDVAAFADSMSALAALEVAQLVEVLITAVEFPEGLPNGVSLGLMARLKRPGVNVLFVGGVKSLTYTEGVGELLPAYGTGSEIVEAVRKMLAAYSNAAPLCEGRHLAVTKLLVFAAYLERYPNLTDALNHGGSECSRRPRTKTMRRAPVRSKKRPATAWGHGGRVTRVILPEVNLPAS